MALLLIQGDGTTLIVVALLVLAGWVVMFITARRMLKRTIEDFRREMDERVNSLLLSIKAAQAQAEETRKASVAAATPAQPLAKPQSTAVAQPAVSGPQPVSHAVEEPQEVPSDVLLVIAAAVTAFLGKKVRVRSSKMLQTPYEIVNPWVQQGRVVIQASHNLGPRSH